MKATLGAGDLYHVFLDRRMRAAGGVGDGSQMLFELEGELSPEDLRGRLDRLLEACPVLGAGLRRWPRWRWQGVEGWRIPLEVEDAPDGPEALFDRWFVRPFARPAEPSFGVVLGRGGGHSYLLLRWLHPLMDAGGADRLVRLLDGADPARYRMHDDPPSLARRARGGSRPGLVLAVHNFVLRYLFAALAPARQARPTGDTTKVHWHTLDEAETAAVEQRASEAAGPLQANHFFLGAAFVAATRTLGLRPGGRLLIPCPIDLRPAAWPGPVFANYSTPVLVLLPAKKLGSLRTATAAVRDRFRLALKRREEAATFWMMSLSRWVPHALYGLLMQGPTVGDPATLYYSSFALGCAEDGQLLGLPLRRFVAASHVLSRPGAAVVFARCGGRLTVAVPDTGLGRGAALLADTLQLVQREALDAAAD